MRFWMQAFLLSLLWVTGMASDAGELSDELQLLKRASTFSCGEYINQATKNQQFAAYKKICEQWQKLDASELNDMLKSATPAGKLYAAALISERNCYSGQPNQMKQGFEALKNDATKVTFRSGCTISDHTVSEISNAFLSKGQFQDFGLSRWCEKPASP